MSEQTPGSGSEPLSLPDNPSLDWLRKHAKRRLAELRQTNRSARLADAQFDLARQYGFPSWRALKAHIDSLSIDGQLFEAARTGTIRTVKTLLDQSPERVHARNEKPYEQTPLHVAAAAGHLAIVNLLLDRGADVNARDVGDNTYAMHWAAAAGHLDIVRRLADAGGDVVGHGDDHDLEVIGWATGWDGCDDDIHRAIAAFLISRGAKHNIFSAIASNSSDAVRQVVADDPAALTRPMSRNEGFRLPIQFAVQKNRPDMVELLLELGADPAATDGSGTDAMGYTSFPNVGRRVIEVLAHHGTMDLFSALALGDLVAATRLLGEDIDSLRPGGRNDGALHRLAKRGDVAAVQWLLDRGADPSGRWDHWGALVTPMHLAAMQGQIEVVRVLLAAGADPSVRDNMHDSTPSGWAEFFRRPEIVALIEGWKT